MSARDELAELVQKYASQTPADWLYDDEAKHIADAILAAGYRKPLTIENDKLVIDDHGFLLLEIGGCTCASSSLGPEYASSHEDGCGYEYLDDLTGPLARSGYKKESK